jgi:hypothetical protein
MIMKLRNKRISIKEDSSMVLMQEIEHYRLANSKIPSSSETKL